MDYKSYHSLYEQNYFKWSGINYDKEKLISFYKRYQIVRLLSVLFKKYKEEYKIMSTIINQYDKKQIYGLLNNDEIITKKCLIEKWARIGVSEILTLGNFKPETYLVLSSLPLNDYQLIVKRINELMEISKNTTTQLD